MRHFYCKEMCNAGPETRQAVRGFSPTTQPMRPTAVRPSSGAHTCERSRLCVVSTARPRSAGKSAPKKCGSQHFPDHLYRRCSLFVCLSVYLCLSVCLPACLPAYLPVRVCLSASQHACRQVEMKGDTLKVFYSASH